MYQAQITSTIDSKPAGPNVAKTISHMLGGTATAEPVDAEQGIWLIDIDSTNEEIIEREGYLTAAIAGYVVEIDLP